MNTKSNIEHSTQLRSEQSPKRPATALPWEELPAARSNLVHVEAGDEGGHAAVCSIPKARQQDAAYIVAACNEYPKLIDDKRRLVEALRNLTLEAEVSKPEGLRKGIERTRALLAELDK